MQMKKVINIKKERIISIKKVWILINYNSLKDNMFKKFQDVIGVKHNDSNNSNNSNNNSNSRSVALFLKHRQSELENDVQVLEDYISMLNFNISSDNIISKISFLMLCHIKCLNYELKQIICF